MGGTSRHLVAAPAERHREHRFLVLVPGEVVVYQVLLAEVVAAADELHILLDIYFLAAGIEVGVVVVVRVNTYVGW